MSAFLQRTGRVLACVMLALATLAAATPAEARRVALVVGNSAYEHAPPLATPANDGRAVAEALRRLGFEVTLLTDVSTGIFGAVLDAFGKDADGAEAVLFYYAGHAFQDGGVNRLVPVDARLDDPAELARETLSMADILPKLGKAGTTLIFLDACRTNPVAASARGPGVAAEGLADMDGGAGTFVAFSTRPGAVSYDRGTGDLSPFAAALLSYIERPGLSVSDVMIRTRNDVEAATVGRQVPWDQSSLREQFYFVDEDAPALSDADALPEFEMAEQSTLIEPPPGSAPPTDAPPADTVATDPVPPIQALTGQTGPIRLAAVAAETRGSVGAAPVVGAATVAAAPAVPDAVAVLAPIAPAAETVPQVGASARLVVPGIGIGAGEAPAGPPAPAATDLPRAVQDELKRIGCYRLAVDGDWGGGSRTALTRYYDVKKTPDDARVMDPTEVLWRGLLTEPDGLCPAPAPAKAATKAASKATTPRAETREERSRRKRAEEAASTPSKPAAKAPAKSGVKCTFLVVAIVCK